VEEFRARITLWQEQKLDKRSSILGRIRDRAPIRKVINRPRVGTLRAKWLTKLE